LVNRGTMDVNSLPKTVTRQRRGCDLNPGPSAPESSTLTTRYQATARHRNQYQYVLLVGRSVVCMSKMSKVVACKWNQSCPWLGLTHGLDCVELGQSADGLVGSGHIKWTHGQL